MRRRRRMRWVARGAAAVVALTGCVGEGEPAPSASPTESVGTPSSGPVELEARAVYDEYLIEVSAMYVEADADYTRLLEWATSEMATREAAGVADLVENGITVTHWYALTSFEVVEVQEASIAVAACVNVEEVRLIGPGGEDVTPTDREPFVPLSLRFERGTGAGILLDAQDPWGPSTGQPPCTA